MDVGRDGERERGEGGCWGFIGSVGGESDGWRARKGKQVVRVSCWGNSSESRCVPAKKAHEKMSGKGTQFGGVVVAGIFAVSCGC